MEHPRFGWGTKDTLAVSPQPEPLPRAVSSAAILSTGGYHLRPRPRCPPAAPDLEKLEFFNLKQLLSEA